MPLTTVPPATEPLTLVDVKRQCRIQGDQDDELLTGYIVAAREACETYTDRSLITQTKVLPLSSLGDSVDLSSGGPVQEIVHIKYKDSEGALQTYDAANYTTHLKNAFVSEIRRTGDLPSDKFTDDDPEGWLITYTCGYGDDVSDVPMILKAGMLCYIANLYDFRGEKDVPKLVYSMWDAEKRASIR
jgi:uncharacterized phiE125 gp8 family phage protein